jgi:hypothetical protein
MPSHATLPRWAIGIKYTSRGTPRAWPSEQSLQTLQLPPRQHPSVVRRALGHLDRSNHFLRQHKNPVAPPRLKPLSSNSLGVQVIAVAPLAAVNYSTETEGFLCPARSPRSDPKSQTTIRHHRRGTYYAGCHQRYNGHQQMPPDDRHQLVRSSGKRASWQRCLEA